MYNKIRCVKYYDLLLLVNEEPQCLCDVCCNKCLPCLLKLEDCEKHTSNFYASAQLLWPEVYCFCPVLPSVHACVLCLHPETLLTRYLAEYLTHLTKLTPLTHYGT